MLNRIKQLIIHKLFGMFDYYIELFPGIKGKVRHTIQRDQSGVPVLCLATHNTTLVNGKIIIYNDNTQPIQSYTHHYLLHSAQHCIVRRYLIVVGRNKLYGYLEV
jgi:hypothetical protein